MRTNHCQEIVDWRLRLEEGGCGKFRVIRDWVSAAYLEFNPDSLGWQLSFEHDINACRVAEKSFEFSREKSELRVANPTGRALAGEFSL
jgi:hypothetical protein